MCVNLHWNSAVCTTWVVLSLTFLSIFRLSHDVLCCATLKQKVIGRRDSWGREVRGKERREEERKRVEERGWRESDRRQKGRRKQERRMECDICRTKKKWGRGQRMDHYALLRQLLSPITTETAEGQWRCIPSHSDLTAPSGYVCVRFCVCVLYYAFV